MPPKHNSNGQTAFLQEQRERFFMRASMLASKNVRKLQRDEWIGAGIPVAKSHSGRISFAVEVQRYLGEHESWPVAADLDEQLPCRQDPDHFQRNWPSGR